MSSQAQSPLTLIQLPEAYDELAPDGSEIRVLSRLPAGAMVHCTQRQGASLAVTNRTIEELWYFLSGQGQVWRKRGDEEWVDDVSPGTSLTIPVGTHFQFRSTGDEPLCFLCITLPPWPGDDEETHVPGYWETE